MPELSHMSLYAALVLGIPLASAVVLALAGRWLPRRLVELQACAAVAGALAAAVAMRLALSNSGLPEAQVHLGTWFAAGDLNVGLDLLLDPVSTIMAVMVCAVSLIIHAHSVFYMLHDDDPARYFCYLNLFVFFMLVIVLAGDLVFLFMGWEGVGFCSFSLIGFWYLEPERVMAGRKAFVLTRIGDVAYIAAMAVLFTNLGTLGLSGVLERVHDLTPATVTLVGLLLLWAAAGKSAQLPLLVWLPDAMAGPTPVSALIHAATMVTAGVYLLIRMYPLLALSPTAMAVVGGVGVATALMAACCALVQRDIKRVLAWSTVSQVGYMVLGVGAGDPAGSFFHLLSHAFFKSLLFMCAGIVIQSLAEEQDIRYMGARTRRAAPAGTTLAFLAGAVALAGLPPFAGYFSKGRILAATLSLGGGTIPAMPGGDIWLLYWLLGTLAALLTAFYTFRLFLLVFTGTPDLEPRAHEHHLPWPMLHVLWPLVLLALTAGALDMPEHYAHEVLGGIWPHEWQTEWLDHAVESTLPLTPIRPAAEELTHTMDSAVAVLGLLAALVLFGPWRRRATADTRQTGISGFLAGGFGLDRSYLEWIGRPYQAFAQTLWQRADVGGIDASYMGTARLAAALADNTRRLTTGRLSTYLAMFLLGLAAVVLLFASRGSLLQENAAPPRISAQAQVPAPAYSAEPRTTGWARP